MDQNNQYQSPTEQYSPVNVQAPTVVPSVDQMVAELANKAFGKALAAVIMCSFPITSIIAMVMGNQALTLVNRAKELAEPYGIFGGGKYIAARVMALIGKYTGLAMTIIWGLYFFIIIALIAGIAA